MDNPATTMSFRPRGNGRYRHTAAELSDLAMDCQVAMQIAFRALHAFQVRLQGVA